MTFNILDTNENIIEIINNKNKRYLFIQASTPFNNEATSILAKDKDFTYQLFGKDLNMPRSFAYLDPECNERYRDRIEFYSQEEVVEDIDKTFSYPMIIKMNRGRVGHNVFLCKNVEAVKDAVATIFDKESANYDYMVLVQEYVDISHEYRAIWFKGEILLTYEKIAIEKNSSLSPLHNDSGKAVYVNDVELIERVQKHINMANLEADFEFLGIDVVIDNNGNMRVLELNTRPGFFYFIRDNGDEKVVEMYEKILKEM